jgi:hypothetical protein
MGINPAPVEEPCDNAVGAGFIPARSTRLERYLVLNDGYSGLMPRLKSSEQERLFQFTVNRWMLGPNYDPVTIVTILLFFMLIMSPSRLSPHLKGHVK